MINIVLPALNEADSIGGLLQWFIDAFEEETIKWKVILVDDGSTDGTADVALSFRDRIELDIVGHPRNLGLAEALKTGLLRAVELAGDKDIIITMDSDGTHLPGLVIRMIRLIKEGNDIIIASRYRAGARVKGVSLFRRSLSRGAALLCKCVFPIHGVRDYTCGYRAYRARLIKKALEDYGGEIISETGFSCMVDLLLKLSRYDPIICEVPLVLRYDLKAGPSKMNVRKTIFDTLRLLCRRRLGMK